MNLTSHSLCSGCSACYAVCPRKAISMQPDEDGFAYPHLDESLCVNCGLCERVCPALHPDETRKPLSVYAVKANNETLRLVSSSGGVFSLLAQEVIRRGGLVFGAAFDHSDWHVYHRSVDNEVVLAELRGSKYVQSDMGDCFQEVRDSLVSGREVLFSGTPCQIAGLKHFLLLSNKVLFEKLILVEIVCQAVPSPFMWGKYLAWRMKSANGNSGTRGKIERIAFRCKELGWKRYSMFIEESNGVIYSSEHNKDAYMRAFMAGLSCRPSCHNCKVRELRSGADLTIADYWSVDQRFPDMDDDKGVSLVLANTEKGRGLIDAVSSDVELNQSDFDHACQINPMIMRSPMRHNKRVYFFSMVKEDNFEELVEKCLCMPVGRRLKHWVGNILRKMGLRK